ncbi:class I SAM-dependent methyltransferase [Paenibacillus sp. GXUN7292]|uniref:class I SAM-dependent methyltransferase n=1 Tax=Paenibacillus sp. GXUN7292 TaxID=3422499 RepID=UPI003D7D5203
MTEALLSERNNIEYWNRFYKEVKISNESTFCTFVKEFLDDKAVVLDIGCGSGRDTFSFANDGYEVVGIDRSVEAIKINETVRNELECNGAKINFYAVDISDAKRLGEIVKSIIANTKEDNRKLVVYARFLLHSINESTENILLSTLSQNMRKGDYLAIEFRTIEDQQLNKIYDNHYRRFIVAEDLLGELEDQYGFNKVYFTKGTGLSLYNNEDPYLSRIIAEKK